MIRDVQTTRFTLPTYVITQWRYQLVRTSLRQFVNSSIDDNVPALKLSFEPLPFAAACVWFWTVRKLVLRLPAVARVTAVTSAPWLVLQ